jgi:hypothetical protein
MLPLSYLKSKQQQQHKNLVTTTTITKTTSPVSKQALKKPSTDTSD